MKRIILLTMVLLSTSLFAQVAKETKLLPFFEAGYCADPTVAIMGGVTQYKDNTNDTTNTYGVELRFGCPVFQIKNYDIRQVLSAIHTDKNNLSTTSIEMNPRIMFELTKDVEFGFGPGLGVVFAKNSAGIKTLRDTVLAVNIGASLHYTPTKNMFIGFESIYQWTQKSDFGNTLDNFRNMIKIGTSF